MRRSPALPEECAILSETARAHLRAVLDELFSVTAEDAQWIHLCQQRWLDPTWQQSSHEARSSVAGRARAKAVYAARPDLLPVSHAVRAAASAITCKRPWHLITSSGLNGFALSLAESAVIEDIDPEAAVGLASAREVIELATWARTATPAVKEVVRALLPDWAEPLSDLVELAESSCAAAVG